MKNLSNAPTIVANLALTTIQFNYVIDAKYL